MPDLNEKIAEIVLAIQSDEELKQSFIEILKFGSSTQQVRVSSLIEVLQKQGAPEVVLAFCELLRDEKFAHAFLDELQKDPA